MVREDMTKEEVLTRLCRITTGVAKTKFGSKHAADCFCGSNPDGLGLRPLFGVLGMGGYRFSDDVISFVEEAVKKALRRGKRRRAGRS